MFIDESIAKANMGLMFLIFSIPVMSLTFVTWTLITRRLPVIFRRVTMILTILLASGIWICIRTNGMTGDGRQLLDWRWAKTSEDRLLEHAENNSSVTISKDFNVKSSNIWPGFRGANRDGIVHNVFLKTDLKKSPPVELWRKPIGPGCSSFAVNQNLIYTQEQRGEFEEVACYDLETGNPVWKHKDKTRFYEPHAGAGPRSTPSIAADRIYTFGATGILNVLNALDGSVIWSRDAASDAEIKVPAWGFSGSTLLTSDAVIVAVAGKLISYDLLTGKPVWTGPDGGQSYSSPVLLNICGIPNVTFMSDSGAVGLDPFSGRKLWEYKWKINGRILQPSVIDSTDLLLCGEYKDIRRITFKKGPQRLEFEVKWSSSSVKDVFNDFVVWKGFAYGFDGPYLTCTDLTDGKLMWRGDRYRGFTLLLADQDLILVLTEKGEIVLVQASPERFTELARFKALNGKTWSHPSLTGNILIVRNAEEMAAFRMQ
jgi:outer membrane protein assembly factor BamB